MTFKMELPRAGHRRIKRDRLRNERYAKSGFNPDIVRYAGGIDAVNHQSKYMPHIGKKQRARNAGHPNGAMHRTPHEHRAFCLGA